jgi:ketosteroid isomerase-like protein
MASAIIDRFFAALGSGDEEAVLALVTPDATFEAQPPARRSSAQLKSASGPCPLSTSASSLLVYATLATDTRPDNHSRRVSGDSHPQAASVERLDEL